MSEAVLHASHLTDRLLAQADIPRFHAAWHPSRLSSLTAAAQADDAWAAGIAEVQLLAARHQFDAAEHQLAALLNEHSPNLLQPVIFTQLFITALSLQRTDIMAMLLNAHPSAPPRNAVSFLSAPAPQMRAEWHLDPAGYCTWWISPSLPGGEAAHRFTASLQAMMDLLSRYARQPQAVPGRVGLSLGDMAHGDGLGYSSFDPNIFLIPDSQFILSRGYASLRESFDAADLAWSDREPIAFWRGATTGFRAPPERSWKSLQRIRLCELSRQHPAHLDAGITSIAQSSSRAEAEEIAAAGLMRPPVPPEQFARFRYQIDIDGNSNAWQGLFMKLLSGSVVLKIGSPHRFRQWYYDRLQPWVNYVPVATDLSDLVAAITLLRADDAFARAIGQAGRALARSLDYEQEMTAALHTVRRAMVAGAKMAGAAE
jgi:hypothetical protein